MNHDEESKNLSALDIFSQCQETLDEAKKKNQSESSSRAQYLRLSKDGTYNIRILPLAPVINAEGKVLPLTRKGYEYPSKEYLLKINTGKVDKKGKDIFQFVSICNARLAFPELENDLLDLYVSTACELYSNDKKKEEMCKKLKESSFNGGLKYDSKRCMYVLDLDKRNDGMQILQLSFAQYKELENRKLKLWQRLAKRGAVPCPISSPLNAYPIEIERKTEAKTSYTFEIITQEDEDQLSEGELQALLDAPRLPDILYKYTRYHLEATIAFLKQVDDQYGINIMSEPAIADCIDQIKMKLPSDDQSHFSIKGNEKEGDDTSSVTLEDLFKIYDQLEDAGKSDRSEEGADLRGQIRQFIEDNDLDIKISRTKTNLDVLQEIEDALGNSNETEESDEEEEAPAPARRKSAPVADEEDEDDGAPASDPSDADDDEEDEEEEESPRHTRNDDTNEPAARPRRTLRPARRR